MNHAFLIMAHNNFSQLQRLIKKLDHKNNKIFIHIDSKANFTENDKKMLEDSCTESEIYFTKRYSVTWGGYSMINVLLRLLEKSTEFQCDYYHFLSGVDFPIKSMEYIHNFFNEHNGTEFIHFCSDEFTKEQHHRVAFYSLFREKFGRNTNSIYYQIERISIAIQRMLKIDRTKKHPDIEIKMGACWFSVTGTFAEYLLSKEQFIKNLCKHTVCADECYIQTIAFNSPFKKNIYFFKENVPANEAFLRSVDWSRPGSAVGAPYDYTIEDYAKLIDSKNLFARKINAQTREGNALIEKLELL